MIRGLVTVILMALFVGLWFWTWSKKRVDEYSEAARVPLEPELDPQLGSPVGDSQSPATESNREQNQ